MEFFNGLLEARSGWQRLSRIIAAAEAIALW
jgi:hypothetical protein